MRTVARRAKSLASCELGCDSDGIAVGVYHPGWVQTDMGGARADITVGESVAGLVSRIDALSLATTGVFEDYRGDPIPF